MSSKSTFLNKCRKVGSVDSNSIAAIEAENLRVQRRLERKQRKATVRVKTPPKQKNNTLTHTPFKVALGRTA